MAGEKTEKATPKKRRDERKKGNVFQSRDIVTAFSVIIVFFSLSILGPYILRQLKYSMRYFFTLSAGIEEFTIDYIPAFSLRVFSILAVIILPLLCISALVSVIFTGVQTRFLFNAKQLGPKLERINPLNGLKRMVSMRSLVELAKSVLKAVIILYVIYLNTRDTVNLIPKLMDMNINQSVTALAKLVFNLAMGCGAVILAIGVLDYFYQWWDYEKRLRMSKQEIRDEYKILEGDPKIKSAIKSRQQKLSMMRMMQKVPLSDVVIVNPQHYAVCLKYEEGKNKAPVVVAKGLDLIAVRIKEIAKENDIEIYENPPLARALYKSAEIDAEIPYEFYEAVAEVLAYIYKIKKEKVAR